MELSPEGQYVLYMASVPLLLLFLALALIFADSGRPTWMYFSKKARAYARSQKVQVMEDCLGIGGTVKNPPRRPR